MNPIFMLCFVATMVLLLFMNAKHWSSMPKSLKRAYWFMYAVTTGLFVCIALGYSVPMPTHYFVSRVSPYIFSFIHGS